jgi:hypothetical protein
VTDQRETKPFRRHRTASQLGLDSRRLERAKTAPQGYPAVKRGSPVALEVPPLPGPEDGAVLEQVLGDRVVRQLRDFQDELTPPPVDTGDIPREPSAAEAWNHASNVNTRTVNLLSAIAQSSGAGMRVGDDIKQLARRLKFWRAVIVVVLIPACSALIAIGLKLYSKGFDDGLAAGWRKSVDQRIEQLERAHRNGSAP